MPNKNYRISYVLPKGFLSPLRTKISNTKNCVELKKPNNKHYQKTKTFYQFHSGKW